jgi:integrase
MATIRKRGDRWQAQSPTPTRGHGRSRWRQKVFDVTKIGGWYFASVYDDFRQWMQAAGVKAAEGSDGKTFHCFRHNWNTGMIAARTNDNLRKVMGGWTLGKGVDVRTYLSTQNLDMKDLKAEIDRLHFAVLVDEPASVEPREMASLVG